MASVILNGVGHLVPATHILNFRYGITQGGPYNLNANAAVQGTLAANQPYSTEIFGLPEDQEYYMIATVETAGGIVAEQSVEGKFNTYRPTNANFIGALSAQTTTGPYVRTLDTGPEFGIVVAALRNYVGADRDVTGVTFNGVAATGIFKNASAVSTRQAILAYYDQPLTGNVTISAAILGGNTNISGALYKITNYSSVTPIQVGGPLNVDNPSISLDLPQGSCFVACGIATAVSSVLNGCQVVDENYVSLASSYMFAGHSSNVNAENGHVVSLTGSGAAESLVTLSFT